MPFRSKDSPPRQHVLLACWYYDRDHHIGVARYAAEAGWVLEDTASQVRGLPAEWTGDGIISFHGRSEEYIRFLNNASKRVPVVDIGEYDHLSNFPRVRTDAVAIASMAVDYFAARGFRNVGFIDSAQQQRRRQAMQEAAQRAGLEFRLISLGDLAKQAATLPLPIGLVAATDGIAVQAMFIFEAANILVPEQVAVLGIDNDLCRCLPAPVMLSSIDTHREQLGYEAAAMLDRLMRGHPRPRVPLDISPIGIVERESTNILAVDDLEVASALRFIFQNYRRSIGVTDVGDRAGISLRRLQTRFQQKMGKTILDELNARRVEHAQKLLAQTPNKIRQIAIDSGFGDVTRFIRAFRRYTGESPRQYRRQHGQ
jgi:LacI family transcriptional regulator